MASYPSEDSNQSNNGKRSYPEEPESSAASPSSSDSTVSAPGGRRKRRRYGGSHMYSSVSQQGSSQEQDSVSGPPCAPPVESDVRNEQVIAQDATMNSVDSVVSDEAPYSPSIQSSPQPPSNSVDQETHSVSAVPARDSSQSPPRIRRPPVSQSAWSALGHHSSASSSASPLPVLPQPHTAEGARLGWRGPSNGTINRPHATNIFSRLASSASSSPTEARSIDSATLGALDRPISQTPPSRWGPGAVIAALLGDILGLSARGGGGTPAAVANATAATPLLPPTVAQNEGQSNVVPLGDHPFARPLRGPSNLGRTLPFPPPPPPSTNTLPPIRPQGLQHARAPPAAAERFPRPFPLGGTSIIVQGAMVARFPQAEDVDSTGQGDSAISRDSNTENMQQNVSNPNVRPSASFPSLTDPVGTAASNVIPLWSDAQTAMLTRLLTIAAAATATSLASSSAGDVDRSNGGTSENVLPGEGQSTVWPTARSETLMHSPRPAVQHRRTSLASTTSVSSMNESGQAGSGRSRWRRSIAFLTSRMLGRFMGAQQSQGQSLVSNTAEAQEADASAVLDAEAEQVASSLGADMSGPRSGAAPLNVNQQGSSTPTHSPLGRTAQAVLSLSEMLQEAIRDGRSPRSSVVEPAADASQSQSTPPLATGDEREGQDTPASAPAQPQPLPEYFQGILHAVRENRLQRGPDGSFERWLYDLTEDLDVAVRTMASHQSESNVGTSTQQEGGSPGGSTLPDRSFSARPRDERAVDVEEGQLSFFRLIRLDTPPGPNGRETREGASSGPATLPSSTAADTGAGTGTTPALVPCVVVGVRSLPVNPDPTPTRSVVDRFRTLLSTAHGEPQPERPQARDQAVQVDPSSETGPRSEEAARTTRGGESNSAQPPSGNPVNASAGTAAVPSPSLAEQSRFLLFVSGGHYPPGHPLLSAPPNIAARDLMILIEVLSSVNAAETAAHNAASASARARALVTREELEAMKSSVKAWRDIKSQVVQEVESQDGTSFTDTMATMMTNPFEKATPDGSPDTTATSNLVPRAGERCAVCLEEWSDEDLVRILDCRHTFHCKCVDQWLMESSNSCPMCRQVGVKKATNASEGRGAGAGDAEQGPNGGGEIEV